MSASGGVEATGDRDQLLALLLGRLTEQLRSGQPTDVEALAREHPELATELRELWGAAQVAEEFAGPKPDSQRTVSRPTQPLAATPPSSPAGLSRAFGDYELLEELGRGGMGVVYKARQRNPERIVALKMILGGELASAARPSQRLAWRAIRTLSRSTKWRRSTASRISA
jgi:serine/threonine-protein kinase